MDQGLSWEDRGRPLLLVPCAANRRFPRNQQFATHTTSNASIPQHYGLSLKMTLLFKTFGVFGRHKVKFPVSLPISDRPANQIQRTRACRLSENDTYPMSHSVVNQGDKGSGTR